MVTDLKRTNQNRRLEGVVHSEVKTSINDDAHTRDVEPTVQAADTVASKGLAIDIHDAVELPLATHLCSLGIIGETSTSVIQRIHKQQRRSTGSSSGSYVAEEPLPVPILVLFKVEHALKVVLEGKVQGLKQRWKPFSPFS